MEINGIGNCQKQRTLEGDRYSLLIQFNVFCQITVTLSSMCSSSCVISGVMGFYQMQLKEVIQYPDLKMEVFQIFREFGNAVLFCLLIEQAMVRTCYCNLQ